MLQLPKTYENHQFFNVFAMSARSLAASFLDARGIKTATQWRPNLFKNLTSPPKREPQRAKCDPCNPDVIQRQPMRIHCPSVKPETHPKPFKNLCA
jgi:hypothetical protein